MGNRYIFDKDSANFRKSRVSIGKILGSALPADFKANVFCYKIP